MKTLAIVLAVAATAAAQEKPFDSAQGKPLIRDLVGINSHTVQFKPKVYVPVCRNVRDYHPVEWDLGQETDVATTFPMARNRVSWEQVYGSWKAEGWDVDVSLMFETIPQKAWKDVPRDAQAYGKAFAKAFGPSAAKPLVSSAEVGNEPGKWDDASYRVMFESMAKGLREGDPKLKVVTCAAIAGKSHDYAKSLDCVKGLEALYDVINIHAYAQLENWPTWKRSFPEDPRLIEYLNHIEGAIKWRNANAPGKPIWLTEFGYDSTTKESPKTGDFAKWVGVTDEQQAQYLVRSILVFSAMDLQRAYIYFFDDKDEPSLHASSGVTRHGRPKPSFHALAHLQRTLGDYRFAKVIAAKAGEVYAYEFRHATDPGKAVVVAWSPTGSGRTATWTISEAVTRIERMPLVGGDVPSSGAAVFDGTAVTLGESPVYLWVKR
jgi:hypothetical protein